MTETRRQIGPDEKPIDFVRPGSPEHDHVFRYIKDRLKFAIEKMTPFHPRWRTNELMLQAYISLGDYDQMLKDMKDKKSAPAMPLAINVPFAWATVNTIVTYLLHMFGGRRPIFQVSSYRAEQVERASNMEMFLQYNADAQRFLRNLYFFLMDGETYGLAVMRTLWSRKTNKRRIIMPQDPDMEALSQSMGVTLPPNIEEQEYVMFEGNSIQNIDPFMFFPDPRVPMHEVSEKGEFVFWRAFQGRMSLIKAEAKGQLKWVSETREDNWAGGLEDRSDFSARGMRSFGEAHPGQASTHDSRVKPNCQLDQGTIELIPYDLGIGTSKVPEKWIVTIMNETQIIQLEPIDLPGDKHPVTVVEPNSMGYAFGQLGTVDFLGPLQGLMSWFLNSHVYNVRASLNNMFVVDPTRVEMQDLRDPEPGKIIRLKNTAFGMADPRLAVTQLAVSDVTRSHVSDFNLMGRLGADLTGATDNMRGLQDGGSRKTATEIRVTGEAGASRLASKGKIYSAMGLSPMAEMWALNAQMNLTESFETNVLGQSAVGKGSIRITPENLQGDFMFPIHDGTLPMDKIGLLDVWKEIFQAVLADPQLRSSYDVLSMFDWIAQLGGGQNIKSFRLNVVPQEQQMQALSSGQGVPMSEIAAMMGGGPVMGGR